MATFEITPDAFGPRGLRILRVMVNAALVLLAALMVGTLIIIVEHYWLGREGGTLVSAFEANVPRFFVYGIAYGIFFEFRSYWCGHRNRLQVELSPDSLFVEGNDWYGARLLQKDEVNYIRENGVIGQQLLLRAAGFHVGNRNHEIDIFIPAGAPGYDQIKTQLSQWCAASLQP